MKKVISSILVASVLVPVTSTMAQEGGLKMPMTFESAGVLPKGIRNVRFMNTQIDGVDKFNSGGTIVPVGSALNKDVKWKDSIEKKDNVLEKAKLEGILAANDVDVNQVIGNTTGMVNIAVEAKVPVIAYGLNEKTTIAMAIPYITTELSIASGFVANENFNSFINDVVAKKSKHNAYKVKNTVETETFNAISTKLADNGYKPLSESEERKTRLGDIKIVTKYQVDKTDNLSTALKLDITAPTGETVDVNKAVDVGAGDGQWDVGLGVASEYVFNKHVSVGGFVGYTVQLEKTGEKRIPEKGDSKITPDVDNNTKVDLGDQTNVQASVKLSFLNGFTFLTGASYQHKSADRYSGSEYSSSRYDYLEKDTVQIMKSYQAGLGFSTIPLFKQKKFKVPLQANLFYTSVNEGKNVIKDDIVTFEMALFF